MCGRLMMCLNLRCGLGLVNDSGHGRTGSTTIISPNLASHTER